MISLFIIGLVEMVIATLWTKTVMETKALASGLVTMVNIILWYYVLRVIIDDITNWQLVIIYALGCMVGTMLTTASLSSQKKKRQRKIKKTAKLNQEALIVYEEQ